MRTVSLRTTIFLTLLLVTAAAVGVLGGGSYRLALGSATDLLDRVLRAEAEAATHRVERVLQDVATASRLRARFLPRGGLTPAAFPDQVRDLGPVLSEYPSLSFASLVLSADGSMVGVNRDGWVQEARPDPGTGRFVWRDYTADRYLAGGPAASSGPGDDPRAGVWYRAGSGGQQAWTEVYEFPGVRGRPYLPGVSCSTPVRGPGGAVAGVLTSDLNLVHLSQVLADLGPVGETGMLFVVELRRDGTRPVIAHPEPDRLVRPDPKGGRRLVSTEQLGDPRVTDFLALSPDLTAPEQGPPVHFISGGVRWGGGSRPLAGDVPRWVVCAVMPESDVMRNVWQNHALTLVTGAAVLLAAVALSSVVAPLLARPLERVARETEAVGRLELEARPPARSFVREIDRLARSVEEMKTGLRSFGKYVPTELVSRVMTTGKESAPDGRRRNVTVFFCDVADFTTMSERLTPERLVLHLRGYMAACSREIVATGGTVDKYIGDAVMAFWNAPADLPDHAAAACAAAVRCQERLAELRERAEMVGREPMYGRIGLNTGDAVAGSVGSDDRLNYTVIGDAVNVASRLEALNKEFGTSILISESTRLAAGPSVVARPLGEVTVKGRAKPVVVYELLGLAAEAGPELLELQDIGERAWAAYQAGRCDDAAALCEQVLALRPGDAAVARLLGTCRLPARPPGVPGH